MRLLTKSGIQHLQNRKKLIENRISELRDQAHEISTTPQYKETPDYYTTIEEKTLLQNEINNIDKILESATTIKEKTFNKAGLGCVVRVKLGKMVYIYQLVDTVETNPQQGMISIRSPLGQCLIGKTSGEEVELVTPTGKIGLKILEIL